MRLKSRRGAEVVEMALVMPLLCLLVFGMVDFGLAIFDKAVITNAAREGARAAIVYRNVDLTKTTIEAAATTAANAAVTSYLNTYLISFAAATPTTTITAASGWASGNPVTVTVTYHYSLLVMPSFIGIGPLDLEGRSVMRME